VQGRPIIEYVENIVEVRVEVPVDRIVEKIVEVSVEVPVDRIVEVPVDRIVEKIVHIEVPVDRIVEKIVHIEVPVDRIVEKVIEKRFEVSTQRPSNSSTDAEQKLIAEINRLNDENEALVEELDHQRANSNRVYDLDNKIRLLVNEIEKLLETNQGWWDKNQLLLSENDKNAKTIEHLNHELHQIKELNLDYIGHHQYLMKQNKQLETQWIEVKGSINGGRNSQEKNEQEMLDLGHEIEKLNACIMRKDHALLGLQKVADKYTALQREYENILKENRNILMSVPVGAVDSPRYAAIIGQS
jgi:hypothetical protein